MYDEIHVWMVDGNDWDKILIQRRDLMFVWLLCPPKRKQPPIGSGPSLG